MHAGQALVLSAHEHNKYHELVKVAIMLVAHAWLLRSYPQIGMQSLIESECKISYLYLSSLDLVQKESQWFSNYAPCSHANYFFPDAFQLERYRYIYS